MGYWDNSCNISKLEGKTIVGIDRLEEGSDSITFRLADGARLEMYHEQDCCESVWLEDIDGNAGGYVISAYESSEDASDSELVYDSGTWTFYRIVSEQGILVLRWLGTSNGYYGEGVSTYYYDAQGVNE